MHARADRRLNRVKVLQAAATLAATRGLSFSMSDVAELAQVSRSTVHRAFAGKAELLDAVAIDNWERTLATVRSHRVRAERAVAPVTLRHFERAVLDVAEEVLKPMITRLPVADRASIVQGRYGVYNSFLLHAERAADRYGVSTHEILQKVGEAGYVGGQEDMIIDVAIELAQR
jgi:AcrR family transcriptional regulator